MPFVLQENTKVPAAFKLHNASGNWLHPGTPGFNVWSGMLGEHSRRYLVRVKQGIERQRKRKSAENEHHVLQPDRIEEKAGPEQNDLEQHPVQHIPEREEAAMIIFRNRRLEIR